MPHITVEYSDSLADCFDRGAFGRALHPLISEIIDTEVGSCRTRFRRIEESVFGDAGTDGTEALVHIEVAVLSGRPPERKAELSRAVLELAREHVRQRPGPTRGRSVYYCVEIRDIDRDSYVWHREDVLV